MICPICQKQYESHDWRCLDCSLSEMLGSREKVEISIAKNEVVSMVKTMGICVTCGSMIVKDDGCRVCKPTFDTLRQQINASLDRIEAVGRLAELDNVLVELQELRIFVEGHNPNEVATSMVMHGLDDKIRLLEERADVLKKSIGG